MRHMLTHCLFLPPLKISVKYIAFLFNETTACQKGHGTTVANLDHFTPLLAILDVVKHYGMIKPGSSVL